MLINEALEDFLLSCKANRLSGKTIQWYSSLLTDFAEYFQGQVLADIPARHIREYIVALQGRNQRYSEAKQKPIQAGGLSNASVSGHIRALHAFWRWCAREYDLKNPMANIKRPKIEVSTPKVIDKRDFVKLFNATGNNETGTRDRALLAFLLDTGCRLGGLIDLEINRLNLQRRQAIVYEKGNKSRIVVFTAYTAALLEMWLEVRISDSKKVFTSLTKQRGGLTMEGVHQALKRLKARAGVTGRINPHAFRHRFAVEYLTNGGDDITLAKLLGHENVNTTKKMYSNFTITELAALHEQRTPLRRLYGLKQGF